MLKIRLARTGRKKLAHYRVVASDSRRTPTAGSVVQLGHYNPHTKELVIDAEKTQVYVNNGAQLSSRMVRLLQDRKDIKLPKWALKNLVIKKAKPKKEQPETETADQKPDEAAAETAAATERQSPENQTEKGKNTGEGQEQPDEQVEPDEDKKNSQGDKEGEASKDSDTKKQSAAAD